MTAVLAWLPVTHSTVFSNARLQEHAIANTFHNSSPVAETADRGHNRHGPKRGGGCCAPFVESWDPVKYNVAWVEVYFRTKWCLDPSSRLAAIDMGQKLGGGGCALFSRVARTPSNTKSPGARPTSVPSGILSWYIQPFGHSEWVSRFLTAHQHIIGHSVP